MKIDKLQNLLAVLASFSVIGSVAEADSIPVNNYSFENPEVAVGSPAYYNVPGWSIFGSGSQGYPEIVWPDSGTGGFNLNPDYTLPGTADAYQCFEVNGSDAGGPGGIYQDVGQLQPNTTYTLVVAIGNETTQTGQATISLVNGTDNTGSVLVSTNVSSTQAPSGSFGDITVTFTTAPVVAGDLTIVLQSTAGVQMAFDNVRLSAPPPNYGTSVALTNSSFEIPALGYGGSTYTIPGWGSVNTGYGVGESDDSGAYYGGNAGDITNLPAPGDGYQMAFINGGNDVNGGGAVWQDIGPLQPSTTYTMLVAVGADPNTTWGEGTGQIILLNANASDFTDTNFTGTVLAATPVSNVGLGGAFRDFSVSFTTPAVVSGDLTLVLNTTNAVQIVYDNVRLYTNAPNLTPVVTAPTLSPATAYPGDLVTVSELASGVGTLNYSFQYDNGTAGASWTTLAGFTTNSVYTNNTTGYTSPAYEFRVVVTNAYGAVTSSPSVLTITNGAPVISKSLVPQNENFVVGQSAQFNTAFDGSRPISYQWQLNGTNVTKGTFSSPVLVITNLQISDAGNYTCIASNVYGMTTNGTGYLTVAATPVPDSFGNIVLLDSVYNPSDFTSVYPLAAGSLISGLLPIDQAGGFSGPGYDSTGGNLANITSGNTITGWNGLQAVTVGDGSGNVNNAGQYVTYLLNTNASPKGYNLTSIVAIGGWANNGRDEVAADVYYSTVSNPGTFVQFAYYNNLPAVPGGATPLNQAVVLSSSGFLATNVAEVKFSFTPTELGGVVENGYVGLAQLQVFGSAATPSSLSVSKSGVNSITLTWTSGTLYSAPSVTGPWTKVIGATTPWPVITTDAPQMFYRLQ